MGKLADAVAAKLGDDWNPDRPPSSPPMPPPSSQGWTELNGKLAAIEGRDGRVTASP